MSTGIPVFLFTLYSFEDDIYLWITCRFLEDQYGFDDSAGASTPPAPLSSHACLSPAPRPWRPSRAARCCPWRSLGPRSVRPPHRKAAPAVGLETNLREVGSCTITKKAPTMAIYRLKAASTTFTFRKNLSKRHNANAKKCLFTVDSWESSPYLKFPEIPKWGSCFQLGK